MQWYVERSYGHPPDFTQRVIDLDTAGNPVRESIFQLSLLPRESRTEEEVREKIRTRVSDSNHPAEYQGSFPAAYRMHERRLRWVSTIHRTFRIAELTETAPHDEISQLNWMTLNPNTLAWTAERRKEIRMMVEQRIPMAEVSFLDAATETDVSVTMGNSGSLHYDFYRYLVSPTGGSEIRDLVLHDRRLEQQRTLVIEFSRGNETVIYRSTYH